MGSLTTFSIIVVFMFTMSHCISELDAKSYYTCTPCKSRAECEQAPTQYCVYGEYEDLCGRRQCAKGPGERCGGPSRVLGECGDGLMCTDKDRCHGCYIPTLECFH